MAVKTKIALALGCSIWAMPVMAQDDSDAPTTEQANVVGEIVVTAQKREQSLSSVPLAVTAVSGEELSANGAYDTSAIGFLSPNVNFANETSRDAVFITIRGVSGTDNRNEADPTTAFHIDGAYVPRLSGANAYFFDLERVEILRGPQGTLYGRNSTSGAVNVISAKPTDELGGHFEMLYGNFDRVLGTGAINLPISGDRLALRGAFIFEDRDGYRNNSPLTGRGDDANDFAGRIHLLARPIDPLTVLLTYEIYDKSGVGGVQGLLPFTGNPRPDLVVTDRREFPLDTQGFRNNNTNSLRAQVDYDLGPMTATYQFAWRREERESLNDLDGTAISDSTLAEDFRSSANTHELRLTSNGDNTIDWMLGGFYLNETINSIFNVQIPTAFGAFSRLDFDFIDNDQKNKSWALFGQTTVALADQLDLTVGARYTRDDKDKPDSAQVIRRLDANGPPPLQTIIQNQSADWDKVTWRAALDYTLNDDTLLYASVSTGYKAGGFNRGASQAIYDPETVTSYEVGAKTNALGNRLRLGLSAFYYDYKDLQLAQVETGDNNVIENITRNATSATVWGIEAEGELRIGATTRIDFAFGYLNAEFDSFPNVLDDLTSAIEDLSGNRLVNAPRFSGTLGIEPFVADLGAGTIKPRVQFHYESDAFLRIQNKDHDRRGDYTRTDARLRYEQRDESWFVEGYVENIENSNVISSVSAGTLIVAVGPSFKGVFLAPRTYGVRVGTKF